jgi:hypothetical protein
MEDAHGEYIESYHLGWTRLIKFLGTHLKSV